MSPSSVLKFFGIIREGDGDSADPGNKPAGNQIGRNAGNIGKDVSSSNPTSSDTSSGSSAERAGSGASDAPREGETMVNATDTAIQYVALEFPPIRAVDT